MDEKRKSANICNEKKTKKMRHLREAHGAAHLSGADRPAEQRNGRRRAALTDPRHRCPGRRGKRYLEP